MPDKKAGKQPAHFLVNSSTRFRKKSLPRHPIRQVAPDQGKHPSLC